MLRLLIVFQNQTDPFQVLCLDHLAWSKHSTNICCISEWMDANPLKQEYWESIYLIIVLLIHQEGIRDFLPFSLPDFVLELLRKIKPCVAYKAAVLQATLPNVFRTMFLNFPANTSGKVAQRRESKAIIMRSDRKAAPSEVLSGKELLNNSNNRFMYSKPFHIPALETSVEQFWTRTIQDRISR